MRRFWWWMVPLALSACGGPSGGGGGGDDDDDDGGAGGGAASPIQAACRNAVDCVEAAGGELDITQCISDSEKALQEADRQGRNV